MDDKSDQRKCYCLVLFDFFMVFFKEPKLINMNLSKVIFSIQQLAFLMLFLLLALPNAEGQDFEYSGYQLQSPFVNEFSASPDGKNLLYNVVTHNSVSHKSRFMIQHLEDGGDDTRLGSLSAHIHGWMDNENVVFQPVDEPFGLIKATVKR